MKETAVPFNEMASLIEKNEAFSGAFVIQPPSGDPITYMQVDNQRNEAMFWSNVITLAKTQIELLDDTSRRQQAGWGRGNSR